MRTEEYIQYLGSNQNLVRQHFSNYHSLFAVVLKMVLKYDKTSGVIKSVDISLGLAIVLLDCLTNELGQISCQLLI